MIYSLCEHDIRLAPHDIPRVTRHDIRSLCGRIMVCAAGARIEITHRTPHAFPSRGRLCGGDVLTDYFDLSPTGDTSMRRQAYITSVGYIMPAGYITRRQADIIE